jgi:hypothetical protein
MRYITVTEDELQSARPGLVLVERLDNNGTFAPVLYGVTIKETVLIAANDALERDFDEEEGQTAPSVNEVALAIPFTSDTLALLTGSGLVLKNEEFSYRAGRDNVRTMWINSTNGVQVTLNDFDTLALSDDDTWLDEFLKEYGVNTGAVEADITVPRDPVPAVQPEPQRAQASKRASRTPVALSGLASSSIDHFLS